VDLLAGARSDAGSRAFFLDCLDDLIDHVAHVARLEQHDEHGVPAREHLERAAANGSAWAMDQLEPPPAPEALLYLVPWAYELLGRSGAGMNGVAPLSFGTIGEWARLTHRDVTPMEVHALLVLDRTLRQPPKE
jgi:hypothetical protein